MELLVRAFPIREGKEVQLMEFAREVRARSSEAADFYGRYGVARESWHVQVTEHGTLVIGVTQMEQRSAADAAPEYAGSRLEFDVWFKRQVEDLSGINPDEQPLGPPTTCVFDWQAAT